MPSRRVPASRRLRVLAQKRRNLRKPLAVAVRADRRVGPENRRLALSLLFSLATLLPSLAVGARRLHDTNRSGWLQLLYILPLLGWILLFFWSAQGAREPNRFGPEA